MYVFGVAVLVIILIVYFYSVQNHNYWSKKNVKFVKPPPFFGTQLYNIIKMPTITEIVGKVYQAFPDERFVGFFIGKSPALLIKDPELLKHVLLLDFDHFQKRETQVELEDTNSVNSFTARSNSLKIFRQIIKFALATDKVKNMYLHFVNCAQRIQMLGGKIVSEGGVTDAFEIMSRFTIEFLCNYGMGVDFNIIMDEQSKFFHYLKYAIASNTMQNRLSVIEKCLPKWFQELCSRHPKMTTVLNDVILKVCKDRNFKPSDRQDFIDTVLELSATDEIVEPTERINSHSSPVVAPLNLADPKIIGFVIYTLFIAGHEGIASSTSFTLHQLAYHPRIQRKIQDQIDEVLSRYDNKLCNDAVAEMTLLEMAYQESLRMFPPGGIIHIVCTKKYTFPDTNVTIDPGTIIVVPIAAIQNDKKYYPDPHEFKPERFTSESIKERNKYVNLSFGQGKRTCVGKKLGLVLSLTSLAALLQRFKFEPAPQSRREIKLNRNSHNVQKIEGGIPIKLVPRISNLQLL